MIFKCIVDFTTFVNKERTQTVLNTNGNLSSKLQKIPSFTEQSTVKYEIEKQCNISNTVNLKVISNLMHFEFIEIYLATFVQNMKFVNVLGNLCPGHLENAIICKDPFSYYYSYYFCAYHIGRV